MNRLVLASSSPRRRALLEGAGIAHTVITPPEDVVVPAGTLPREAVRMIAEAKAVAVARVAPAGAVVLAADTMVVGPTGPLGKPGSREEARTMLAELEGRRHTVLTGICVLPSGGRPGPLSAVSESVVSLRRLGAAEIARYVDTGEPMDKAGGYAIQGDAGRFVDGVRGRVDTVIGLDVDLACRLLRRAGANGLPDTVADVHAAGRPPASSPVPSPVGSL